MKKILIGWLAVSLAILVIGGSALSMNDEPVTGYLLPFGVMSTLVLVTMLGVRFFLERTSLLWVLTGLVGLAFTIALYGGLAAVAVVCLFCAIEGVAIICGVALWKTASYSLPGSDAPSHDQR